MRGAHDEEEEMATILAVSDVFFINPVVISRAWI